MPIASLDVPWSVLSCTAPKCRWCVPRLSCYTRLTFQNSVKTVPRATKSTISYQSSRVGRRHEQEKVCHGLWHDPPFRNAGVVCQVLEMLTDFSVCTGCAIFTIWLSFAHKRALRPRPNTSTYDQYICCAGRRKCAPLRSRTCLLRVHIRHTPKAHIKAYA